MAEEKHLHDVAEAECEDECLCSGRKVTMIFACSGGSNVGQMANKAAVDLSCEEPAVRFACITGIGGHVSGIVESTRAADRIVVVDGCPVHCGKRTLEHAGFHPDVSLEVTDLGIEKKHDLVADPEKTRKVVEKLKEMV